MKLFQKSPALWLRCRRWGGWCSPHCIIHTSSHPIPDNTGSEAGNAIWFAAKTASQLHLDSNTFAGNSGVSATVCWAAGLWAKTGMRGVPKVWVTTGVTPTVRPFPSNNNCYAYMSQVPSS